MALTDDDIDRIGDKVEIRMLKAFNEHRTADHEPLEHRVQYLQKTVYGFQVLWGSVATYFGIAGGHK